jgi:hypothetical protein
MRMRTSVPPGVFAGAENHLTEPPRKSPHGTLEIVTHCWRYGRLLAYQLSSLWLYPPRTPTTITVFFTHAGDQRTAIMVDHFARRPDKPPTVTLRPWELPPTQLFRRAIGRNLAALATTADVVWFADCDHVFGPGCIDSLMALMSPSDKLVFPEVVHKCRHAFGDRLIQAVTEHGMWDAPLKKFHPKRQIAAIGGIQIVTGATAREHGYLKDSRRWLRPAKRWVRTMEDPYFRRCLGADYGRPLPIESTYRICHSKYGRLHLGVEL